MGSLGRPPGGRRGGLAAGPRTLCLTIVVLIAVLATLAVIVTRYEALRAWRLEAVDEEAIARLEGEATALVIARDVAAALGALMLGFLLYFGIASSRRSREDREEQEGLWRALSEARDELEDRVRSRTAELEERTSQLVRINEERICSEARARLILDSASEGILGIDRGGRLSFSNKASMELLGFSPEDFSGLPVHGLFHRKCPDGCGFPQGGCPLYDAVARGIEVRNAEETFWRRDGSSFLADFSISPLSEGPGEPDGAVIVIRDITERKRAQDLLEESERRLRSIIDNSPLGIVHLGADGVILSCNERFAGIIGVERGLIIGIDAVSAASSDEMKAAIRKALRGARAEYEGEYVARSGERPIPLHVIFNPIEVGHDPTAVIANLEDVTYRREVERELNEHIEELERINRLTVDREERMIGLKREVNDLLEASGREAKYKIVEP